MHTRHILVALILITSAATLTSVQAQEVLTGMFRLSQTTTEVVGPQMAQALAEIIAIDEELQWQVYVPEPYRPDRPPGIFMFVDPHRLYIGSAGSGTLVAINVLLTRNTFAGGVYMSGSFHWGEQEPPELDQLQRKYHLFITGSNDKAKTAVRRDYESYKKDGIENAKLIFETGRLRNMPEPEHIDEAIRYLDSHLTR